MSLLRSHFPLIILCLAVRQLTAEGASPHSCFYNKTHSFPLSGTPVYFYHSFVGLVFLLKAFADSKIQCTPFLSDASSRFSADFTCCSAMHYFGHFGQR